MMSLETPKKGNLGSPGKSCRLYLIEVEVGSEADNHLKTLGAQPTRPRGWNWHKIGSSRSLALALFHFAQSLGCENRLRILLHSLFRQEFKRLDRLEAEQ